MAASADLIFFAIQSGIRLGQQARQAYVDSTRNRALALPLPNFNPEPNVGSALIFFRNIPEDKVPMPIRGAMRKARANPQSPGLDEKEISRVLDYFNEHQMLMPDAWELIKTSPEGGYLTRHSVEATIKIRQWERAAKWQESGQWEAGGEPGPSPLQRVAGTIFEIGVDYFTQVPGALNEQTRNGKAVRAVLGVLDDVEFADKPIGDLPTRLFLATLDGVVENTELLTSDEETQKLVSVTAGALARDVSVRIQKLREENGGTSDADREHGIVQWAEIVFRSVLSSGGQLVASDPKTYLGIDKKGDAALVTKVSESVIDFVLQLPEGELNRTFGTEGLNIIVTSALQVVGEHPEIILRSDANGKITGASAEGLKLLLSDIATELGNMPRLLYRPDLIPEITRLIVERSGHNLTVLWPQLTGSPQKNLLVVASQKTLAILSETPPDGVRWRLQFDDTDLIVVTEMVLDAFIENPGWLIDHAGQANENYGVALEAAITVLRERGDARLTSETGIEILLAALHAAGLRQEFLGVVSGDKKLVAAVIEVILATLFPGQGELNARAVSVLLRQEIISSLVDESMQALMRVDLASAVTQLQHLDAIKDLLQNHIDQVVAGKSWNIDIFIEGLLLVLPPDLVTNP